MVTIREIAREAGVSPATVSFVLNGRAAEMKISPGRAAEIMDIARRNKYRPHGGARSMRTQQSHQIGVLLRNAPDRPLHGPATFEILLGINLRLETHGYVTSLVRIGDVESDSSRVFRERVLDGLIVIDALPETVNRRVEELVSACIWLETNVWKPKRCIRRDEAHAGSTVAERVVGLGYRRMVFVGRGSAGDPHFSLAARQRSAVSTCVGAGLEVVELDLNKKASSEVADRFCGLLAPETAVIAYDAMLARQLAIIAMDRGMRPPVDFGLACCDENHEVRETWQELTRVGFDRLSLGQLAADMVLRVVRGDEAEPASTLFRGELVEGSTLSGR